MTVGIGHVNSYHELAMRMRLMGLVPITPELYGFCSTSSEKLDTSLKAIDFGIDCGTEDFGGYTFDGLMSMVVNCCIRKDIPIPYGVRKFMNTITIEASMKVVPVEMFSVSSISKAIIQNGIESIKTGAFSNCRNLAEVNIPDSVTSIGDMAFNGCSGLTSVTIPASVTSIGSCAFARCRGLTSVTIPDGVTSIGMEAFSGCSGLTKVTIPGRVTNIGDWAFFGCSGLTRVTIPNSVTSIGDLAFYRCKKLSEVVFASKSHDDVKSMKNYPWGLLDLSVIRCEP